MKKILCIVLAIVIACGIGVGIYMTSGDCGDNVRWRFNVLTGTLTISGEGEMYNYSSVVPGNFGAPWKNLDLIDNIKKIEIKHGVTSIGDWAFHKCIKLKEIIIPNSVSSIGAHAFFWCTSLESITIPDSVTSIGDSAFFNCKSLTNISVDCDNQHYSNDRYGVLFNKDRSTLVQYPIGNARTSYTIPDSVITIGSKAFSYCSNLISISFPNSVASIGIQAVKYCTQLTTIYGTADSYAENWADKNKINFVVISN